MPVVTVYDCWYEVVEQGYKGRMPVIHLICRDEQRRRWHVEVTHFRPYFCVEMSEALDRSDELDSDERVLRIQTVDRDGNDERAVTDESLARIVCETPWDIADLRETFDTDREADVRFADRFLIDLNIKHQMFVPKAAWDRRIHVDEVSSADATEVPSTPPRVVTYDIEVQQTDEGPAVVSEKGTEYADNPITAITAYDSYTKEYWVGILAHPKWADANLDVIYDAIDDAGVHVGHDHVYAHEREMLADFAEYLANINVDVLTGWNSNSFDTPYLVNRCFSEDIYAIENVSPTGHVERMDGEGSWLNGDIKGVVCFDLLTGYKKTQRHELDSYRLANVAAEETDVGKLDIDGIDEAWENDPATFTKYSIRDVQATVAIDEKVGILT